MSENTNLHAHKRERMSEVARILSMVDDEVRDLWPGTDAHDSIQLVRVKFERIRLQLSQAWTRQDAAADRERMARVAASLDLSTERLRVLAATTIALPKR